MVTFYPATQQEPLEFLLVQDLRHQRFGPQPDWVRFPQGQIMRKESPEAAALREAYEELFYDQSLNGAVCIHGRSRVTVEQEWSPKKIKEWLEEHQEKDCSREDRNGYRGVRLRFLLTELDRSVPLRLNPLELGQHIGRPTLEEIFELSLKDDPHTTKNPLFLGYQGRIPDVLYEYRHLFPGIEPLYERYQRLRPTKRSMKSTRELLAATRSSE